MPVAGGRDSEDHERKKEGNREKIDLFLPF